MDKDKETGFMIRESYQALASIVQDMQEKMIHTTGMLKRLEVDYDTVASIQQSLISFGNELEEAFHIGHSEIIHNFQNCCEILYQYSQRAENREMLADQLLNEIAKWQSALGNSISVVDRKLSLVAIIRDEGEYIEEWLEFHFLLGVSHIYLYDNESRDGTKEKLQKYIRQGLVTYIWWPGPAAQLPAYNHAVENFKYESTYMGFIDADEFLMPVQDVDLCQVVDEVFALATERLAYLGGACGGIGVNWRMYGTSFHTDKPDGLVIENYQYRALDRYNENGHIKTICNPRVVVAFERNPHCVRYLDGYYCTSENGSYIPDAFFYDGICCRLRINHYYSKSEVELNQRLEKGKPSRYNKKLTKEEIAQRIGQIRENFNKLYDPIAERYAAGVKKQLVCRNME